MHVTLTETTPRAIKPVPAEPTTERFPFRRDIALAEARLYALGYDEETTDLIIADIRRCGSAWCSSHLDPASEYEHAEAIEAILIDHADWNSPAWGEVHPERDRREFGGSRGYAGLALRGVAR